MHPPARPTGFARGFTLVELLVVIVIIAMLMALVMPAVNSAREAGRRTSCMNNQFQQAFAIVRFNDSKRYIPGWKNAVVTSSGTNFFSWPVMILPNLERKDVYNAFTGGSSVPIYVSTFACPSTPPDNLVAPTLAYAGSAGAASNAVNSRATGVMLDTTATGALAARVTIDDVANGDGTATTLLLSEKCISGTSNPPMYQATWDVRPTTSGSFAFGNGFSTWVTGSSYSTPIPAFGIVGTTAVAKVININAVGSATVAGQVNQPSSNHHGGAVAAFCDGHTQFVKDALAPRVYAQLMSWNHTTAMGSSPYNVSAWASGYPVLLELDYQ